MNMLLGVGDVGGALGNICGISGSPTQEFSASALLHSAGIKAFVPIPVAPPASFFLTREASWDGYLNVESLHTGETVSLQFRTFNGALISGEIFSGKRIASMEGINWDDLADTTGITTSEWQTAMLAWIGHPPVYNTINSMWDYILWSSVLNKVYVYANTYNPFAVSGGVHAYSVPTFPILATPTSEVFGDMIGSFAGRVSREVSATNYGVNLLVVGSMEYNTSITPNHEVPKYLTGE
jgi:hypothetical protein